MLTFITNKIRKWRETNKAIRELNNMSDKELEDIGISRYDIRDVILHGKESY